MQNMLLFLKEIKAKALFIALGIVSSIWFLIRVIPKPSRASYPCIQASAPFMSAFVIWLTATLSSVYIFKKSVFLFKKNHYKMAVFLFIPALAFGIISISFNLDPIKATTVEMASTSDFPANEPMGTALGINPGRVVWSWNPDATDETCTNTVNEDGVIDNNDDVYYLPRNNNEAVIDGMLEEIILSVTGESTIANAWNSIFSYYNNRTSGTTDGYAAGEKIYIKTNNQGIGLTFIMNDDMSQQDYPVWGNYPPHMTATSPYAIRATIKQLVNQVGIPQQDIYVGDPHNNFNDIYYDILRPDFPDIHIMGVSEGGIDCEAHGRTKSTLGTDDVIHYSDNGDKIEGGSDRLYQELLDAKYIVNIAAMKSHIRGGVTLFTKSHFGSHTRGDAFHLHPGLVGENSGYAKYRVLTDLMGHKDLGGKTILCILDALWGGKPHELDEPRKYNMYPFNGDYTSSLFASLDNVAIASVAYDFLRTEYSEANWGGEAYPNMHGTDDFLHQAADETQWPSGITYDPEGDGTKLNSLGVHEHWNNANDMEYSQNLGSGEGIELVKLLHGTVGVQEKTIQVAVTPNPTTDYITLQGIGNTSKVFIYNTNGQLVKQVNHTSTQINVTDLKSGIYILHVKTDGQIIKSHFVKE